MKLYNLYEELILEGLITEGVATDQINQAIDGEFANNGRKFIRMYKIRYDGEKEGGNGDRNIVVHAAGKTSTGKDAVRAYQVYGDTANPRRTTPKGWRIFLLDRITHWEPTNLKYWKAFDASDDAEVVGTNITNKNGDAMLSGVRVVDFSETGDDRKEKEVNNRDIPDTYKYDNADSSGEPVVDPTDDVVNKFDAADSEENDTTDPTVNNTGTSFDNNNDNEYEEDEIETQNVEDKEEENL